VLLAVQAVQAGLVEWVGLLAELVALELEELQSVEAVGLFCHLS